MTSYKDQLYTNSKKVSKLTNEGVIFGNIDPSLLVKIDY